MSEVENKLPFIPEDWSDAATSVSSMSLQPVVALVCGPKNSGKSTFSRNLVQILLQRSLLFCCFSLLFDPLEKSALGETSFFTLSWLLCLNKFAES